VPNHGRRNNEKALHDPSSPPFGRPAEGLLDMYLRARRLVQIAIKGAGWENGNLDVVVQNLAQSAEEAKDDLGQVEGTHSYLFVRTTG
jgi:hypothetical protein